MPNKHTPKGTAAHMAGRKVELLDFYGDKNRVVTSTTVDKGLFQFSFSDDSPTGMYRLKFEKGRNVDVIYNRKDIELSISKPNVQAGRYALFDGIDVLSSGDSRLYYGFLRTLDLRRKRTTLLNQLKLLYPPSKDKDKITDQDTTGTPETESGSFYGQLEVEMRNLHEGFEGYIQKLIDDNPGSYAVKIIKTVKTPVLNVAMSGESPRRLLSGEGLKEWLKERFWDNVDLADATLLHSAVIPSKIFEYISLYGNKRMSREEQEMAFIEAVDVVLFKARADKTVFSVVLDIVTRRFEKSKFELVLTYITENYILSDSGCEDTEGVISEDRASELRDKVETIKKMAISIDEERTAWQNSISKGQYKWINYSELTGWEGEIVKEYGVWSTPRMCLLDREKRIVAKPATVQELEKNLAPLKLVKTE